VRGNIGTVNSLLRPKIPLLTELENIFWLGGYKYFAPTALPTTRSIPLPKLKPSASGATSL
jgi:hypothetical protein